MQRGLAGKDEEADVVEDGEAAKRLRDVLEGDVGSRFLSLAVGAGLEAVVLMMNADAFNDRLDRRRIGNLLRRPRGLVGEDEWRLPAVIVSDKRRLGNFLWWRELARPSFGVSIQQEFLSSSPAILDHRLSMGRSVWLLLNELIPYAPGQSKRWARVIWTLCQSPWR